MPLQHHTPSDRVKKHQIWTSHRLPCKHQCNSTKRRGLAASAVGLHLSLVASKKTPRTGSRHTRSISYVALMVLRKGAPLPKISTNQPSCRHRSTSPRCFTHAPSHCHHSSKSRKSLAPSFDVVLHQVAPTKPSNPPRSTASLVIPRYRTKSQLKSKGSEC